MTEATRPSTDWLSRVRTVWNGRAQRLNAMLCDAGMPVQVANLSSIWTVCYTRPSRYNWMLQYYLRAEGYDGTFAFKPLPQFQPGDVNRDRPPAPPVPVNYRGDGRVGAGQGQAGLIQEETLFPRIADVARQRRHRPQCSTGASPPPADANP